uniref:ATP synthase complex subunit 8 n=1 Tax=Sophonia fuscomarginata TaxID=3092774 RepID=A0AAF1C0H8_9HEMI|nr:ATP synthase F0 subunit 8 [Sophonia fuscomarginata]WPC85263.1 ATP synthase F0 subunit 8 [Sophonia fuscomarginata]
MPQMSPIWWFLLMMYFIIILMMFNSMIYFLFYTKMCNSLFLKKNKFNWKW